MITKSFWRCRASFKADKNVARGEKRWRYPQILNGRQSLPDDWVANDRILVFAQRFLGSPRGQHCNSPGRKIWRKVVSTSKKKDFRERKSLFRRCFSSLSSRLPFEISVSSFMETIVENEANFGFKCKCLINCVDSNKFTNKNAILTNVVTYG